jgi:hypothetical protein
MPVNHNFFRLNREGKVDQVADSHAYHNTLKKLLCAVNYIKISSLNIMTSAQASGSAVELMESCAHKVIRRSGTGHP